MTAAEDSDVNRWIDQTIREDICADHSWSGMEVIDTSVTTVASTASYALPSATVHKDVAWVEIRLNATSEWQRLAEEDIDVLLDGREYGSLTTGFPRSWARLADSFYLKPIPDGAYAIRMRVWNYLAALSGDSATNFVTLYYTKLLEYGATKRGWDYYDEIEKSQYYLGLYQQELGKAISVDRRRMRPANSVFRPSVRAGRKASGQAGGIWSRIWSGDLYGWY